MSESQAAADEGSTAEQGGESLSRLTEGAALDHQGCDWSGTSATVGRFNEDLHAACQADAAKFINEAFKRLEGMAAEPNTALWFTTQYRDLVISPDGEHSGQLRVAIHSEGGVKEEGYTSQLAALRIISDFCGIAAGTSRDLSLIVTDVAIVDEYIVADSPVWADTEAARYRRADRGANFRTSDLSVSPYAVLFRGLVERDVVQEYDLPDAHEERLKDHLDLRCH